VTELPPELKDREMDVEHVSIPLYAGDFAWKLQYKVLPEKRIKLGVMLEEENRGIRIQSVAPNSNAGRAGLQKGDVLLALDGTELVDTEDLADKLQKKNIGDKTTLRIRRDSREFAVEVQLLETKP
ncbi:MAG: PDZ domain-containing protein, partial [Nitrospinae bacterium]|nr:PDZ domain-containing protein [Nitrospinota bacterium]